MYKEKISRNRAFNMKMAEYNIKNLADAGEKLEKILEEDATFYNKNNKIITITDLIDIQEEFGNLTEIDLLYFEANTSPNSRNNDLKLLLETNSDPSKVDIILKIIEIEDEIANEKDLANQRERDLANSKESDLANIREIEPEIVGEKDPPLIKKEMDLVCGNKSNPQIIENCLEESLSNTNNIKVSYKPYKIVGCFPEEIHFSEVVKKKKLIIKNIKTPMGLEPQRENKLKKGLSKNFSKEREINLNQESFEKIELKSREFSGKWTIMNGHPNNIEKHLNNIVCVCYKLKSQLAENDKKLITRYLEVEIKLGMAAAEEEKELIESYNKENLQKIKNYFEGQNYGNMLSVTENLLGKIRPFNISLVQELMSKGEESSKKMMNRNVVVLLGPTGAGKSTLLHFLAGSNFEKTQVKGINHLNPYRNDTYEGLINKVTCSPLSKSETRYLSTVEIGDLLFCDTPGFGDTAGPEVDIVNGFGIINAIKQSSSARVIVLIRETNIGARLIELRNLLSELKEICPEIDDYLGSFMFVYTNFSQSEKESIYHRLKSLTTNVEYNNSYNKIIERMMEFAKYKVVKQHFQSDDLDNLLKSDDDDDDDDDNNNNCFFIDPLQQNPSLLLKRIKNLRKIEKPKYAFNHFLNERSKVSEQLRKHEGSIYKNLTVRENIPLAFYKLQELDYLMKISNENELFSNSYDKIIKRVSENFEEKFKTDIENIERFIKSEDFILCLEEIEIYRRSFEFFIRAKEIFNLPKIGDYLKFSPNNYISQLESFGEFLLTGFDCALKENAFGTAVKIRNKVNFISNYFPEARLNSKEIDKCLEKFCNMKLMSFKEKKVTASKYFGQELMNEIKELALILFELSESFPDVNELSSKNLDNEFRSFCECLRIKELDLHRINEEQHCLKVIDFVKGVRLAMDFEASHNNIDFGPLDSLLNTLVGQLKQKAVNTQKIFNEKINEDLKMAIQCAKGTFIILSNIKKIASAATLSCPRLLDIEYLLDNIYTHINILLKYARKEPKPNLFFSYICNIIVALNREKEWIDELKPEAVNTLNEKITKSGLKFCEKIHSNATNLLKKAREYYSDDSISIDLALLERKITGFKQQILKFVPSAEGIIKKFEDEVQLKYKPLLNRMKEKYIKLIQTINPVENQIEKRMIKMDHLYLRDMSAIEYFINDCAEIRNSINQLLEDYNEQTMMSFSGKLKEFFEICTELDNNIDSMIQPRISDKNEPDQLNINDQKTQLKKLISDLHILMEEDYLGEDTHSFKDLKEFDTARKDIKKELKKKMKVEIEKIKDERDLCSQTCQEAKAYFYNEIFHYFLKFNEIYPEMELRKNYFEFNRLRKNNMGEDLEAINKEIKKLQFFNTQQIINNQIAIHKKTNDKTAKDKLLNIGYLFKNLIEEIESEVLSLYKKLFECLSSNIDDNEKLLEYFQELAKREIKLRTLADFLENYNELDVAINIKNLRNLIDSIASQLNRGFGKKTENLSYLISKYNINEAETDIKFLKIIEELIKNLLSKEYLTILLKLGEKFEKKIDKLNTIYLADPEKVLKHPPTLMIEKLKRHNDLQSQVMQNLRQLFSNLIKEFKSLDPNIDRAMRSRLEGRIKTYLKYCPEEIKEECHDDMKDISKGTQARIDSVNKQLKTCIENEMYEEFEEIILSNDDLIGIDEHINKIIQTKSFNLFEEGLMLLCSCQEIFPSILIIIKSLKMLNDYLNVSKFNYSNKINFGENLENLKTMLNEKIGNELEVFEFPNYKLGKSKSINDNNIRFFLSLEDSCTIENYELFEFYTPGTFETVKEIKNNINNNIEMCFTIYHSDIQVDGDLSKASRMFKFLDKFSILIEFIKNDRTSNFEFREKDLYDSILNLGKIDEIQKYIYNLVNEKIIIPEKLIIEAKDNEDFSERKVKEIISAYRSSEKIINEFRSIQSFFKEKKITKIEDCREAIKKRFLREIKGISKYLAKIITENFQENFINEKKLKEFDCLFEFVDKLVENLKINVDEHEDLYTMHFPAMIQNITKKKYNEPKENSEIKEEEKKLEKLEDSIESRHFFMKNCLLHLLKIKLKDKRFCIKHYANEYSEYLEKLNVKF